ncbi:hypothetical protein CEUSTIGMA_g12580.t1 [Chlamydomonas eustigma]|uniref:Protein kinase domain-containing protein n=1 Tax=Chlamydomonas eustigma TaxID=1157962 RepID=A0A250XQF4_9CHLO|nr:hypothetical protein CEUSTIGMA_g12580.t1 [Chlamydomonas eustigma]|eukprot:GAX85162.1 hypothetical protein CEUSTIGMA_g12580.t1 [Chlamydomonas eustigma]
MGRGGRHLNKEAYMLISAMKSSEKKNTHRVSSRSQGRGRVENTRHNDDRQDTTTTLFGRSTAAAEGSRQHEEQCENIVDIIAYGGGGGAHISEQYEQLMAKSARLLNLCTVLLRRYPLPPGVCFAMLATNADHDGTLFMQMMHDQQSSDVVHAVAACQDEEGAVVVMPVHHDSVEAACQDEEGTVVMPAVHHDSVEAACKDEEGAVVVMPVHHDSVEAACQDEEGAVVMPAVHHDIVMPAVHHDSVEAACQDEEGVVVMPVHHGSVEAACQQDDEEGVVVMPVHHDSVEAACQDEEGAVVVMPAVHHDSVEAACCQQDDEASTLITHTAATSDESSNEDSSDDYLTGAVTPISMLSQHAALRPPTVVFMTGPSGRIDDDNRAVCRVEDRRGARKCEATTADDVATAVEALEEEARDLKSRLNGLVGVMVKQQRRHQEELRRKELEHEARCVQVANEGQAAMIAMWRRLALPVEGVPAAYSAPSSPALVAGGSAVNDQTLMSLSSTTSTTGHYLRVVYDSQLSQLCELGRGGFSKVYLVSPSPALPSSVMLPAGKHHGWGQQRQCYAYKRCTQVETRGMLEEEIMCMEHVRSTGAAMQVEAVVYGQSPEAGEEGQVIITGYVMQAMQFGSMEEMIQRWHSTGLLGCSEASISRGSSVRTALEVITLIIKVAEAIQKLHDVGLLHLDIKAGNILLTHQQGEDCCDMEVKISDFGTSQLLLPGLGYVQGPTSGSIDHQAPECLMPGSQVNRSADVYALGCLLAHIINGSSPYAEEGMPYHEHKAYLLHGSLPDLDLDAAWLAKFGERSGRILSCLVTSCRSHMPEDRPDMQEVICALRQAGAATLADLYLLETAAGAVGAAVGSSCNIALMPLPSCSGGQEEEKHQRLAVPDHLSINGGLAIAKEVSRLPLEMKEVVESVSPVDKAYQAYMTEELRKQAVLKTITPEQCLPASLFVACVVSGSVIASGGCADVLDMVVVGCPDLVFKLSKQGAVNQDCIEKEVVAMQLISCPRHVLQFAAVVYEDIVDGIRIPNPKVVGYCMERMDGSLHDFLTRTVLQPKMFLDLMRKCAVALSHVHLAGYVHLDVKSGNYLYRVVQPAATSNGMPVAAGMEVVEVKISDLGMCQRLDKQGTTRGPTGGTLPYSAPETLRTGAEVTCSADVWSLGCMLFSVLNSIAPPHLGLWPSMSEAEIKAVLLQGRGPELSPSTSEYLATAFGFAGGVMLERMVKACLSHEAVRRPSLDQVIRVLDQVMVRL